jgi:hypothetical protein
VPINAISSFLCSTFSAEYYIVITLTKATFTKSVKNKHHLTHLSDEISQTVF